MLMFFGSASDCQHWQISTYPSLSLRAEVQIKTFLKPTLRKFLLLSWGKFPSSHHTRVIFLSLAPAFINHSLLSCFYILRYFQLTYISLCSSPLCFVKAFCPLPPNKLRQRSLKRRVGLIWLSSDRFWHFAFFLSFPSSSICLLH